MTKRERVQMGLFIAVLVGTAAAQVASMAHMVEAYGWANSPSMAWILAVVTVILSAVFVALSVISPAGRARQAATAGVVLLGVTEWAGNFGVGGLFVQTRMPGQIADFFLISHGLAERLAAFILAGFLPVLVFIAVYAITETGKKFLEEPPANMFAEQVLRSLGQESEAIHSNGAAKRGG